MSKSSNEASNQRYFAIFFDGSSTWRNYQSQKLQELQASIKEQSQNVSKFCISCNNHDSEKFTRMNATCRQFQEIKYIYVHTDSTIADGNFKTQDL